MSRVGWLSGGASNSQVAFDSEWNGPAGDRRQSTPMVLRMEPPESVVETSRLREFELIQALDGVGPVQPCYWVDADADCLPHPSPTYAIVNGATRPSSLKLTQIQ